MTAPETFLVGAYDYRLVALSALIAVLASYTALDLGGRVTAARGAARLPWLIGGATAMGIGIWSMHYVAMLAFSLPVPVQYDWPTVLLSLIAGILSSVVALFVVSRREMGSLRAIAGSIFMGGGIVALHYIAMDAMRLPAMCHYSPALVTLSVIFAIAGSLLSLRLAFLFRGEATGRGSRKLASAMLMGAAISTMHYTGMAAASFAPSAAVQDFSHAVTISLLGTVGIAVVTVMVLGIALLTALVDQLQRRRALLDELFEQAPEAVALLKPDDQVVRVNRQFTHVFGYAPPEALGRRLRELIVPDESRDEYQRYADLSARGQRVEAEGVRQRKDGSRLHVSIVRVPVSVPGGQVAVYAMFHDITERKRAEAERERLFVEVETARERLESLSRQLVEAQEEERRRIARELHDEIGQALTALKFNLQSARRTAGAAVPVLDESIDIAERTLQQVRDLSLDLRPSLLDDLGLGAALRWYLDRQAQRTGWRTRFTSDPPELRLATHLETVCFRVAQEALTNVARHARATQVWLDVRCRSGVLLLTIRDDGVGFDVEAAHRRALGGHSFGVLGMQERVALAGGRLDIHSTPAGGTEIRMSLPIAAVVTPSTAAPERSS